MCLCRAYGRGVSTAMEERNHKVGFTPGPWVVDPQAWMEGIDGSIPHYLVTGTIGGKSGRTVANIGEWTDRPNALADARLIAQAPAMYAAIEQLLEGAIADPDVLEAIVNAVEGTKP